MSDIYFNVYDFGAKGDGVTDDTKSFESALEKAENVGGCVLVPMGKYRIKPIKIPSNITIRGNASWGYSGFGYGNNKLLKEEPIDKEVNGNTVIMPLCADGLGLFDMSQSFGTRIIGISLDGMFLGENFHGIFSLGRSEMQSLVFEDIRISHFTGSGIRLFKTNGFSVRRSLIIKNQSHAIDCSGSGHGHIMDNQLAYNLGAGLYAFREIDDGSIIGTNNLLITANRIEGGYPGGIYIWNTDSIGITGNSFDGCRGPAITLINSENCSLTGNMSRIHGRTKEMDENCHYRIENGKGLAIAGNTLWCWYKLIKQREGKIATGPFFGMILKDLYDCVIYGNAMHECCSQELFNSIGDHINTEISQNSGKVYQLE